ncbi:MAG: phosphotransferase [Acidimicrobiales bacterium]
MATLPEPQQCTAPGTGRQYRTAWPAYQLAAPFAARHDDLALPARGFPAGLESLLSGREVAQLASRYLGPEISARARYLRLTPGSRASVLFAVSAPGLQTWAVASYLPGRNLRRRAAEAASRLCPDDRVDERAGVSPPISVLPESEALLEWYPASLDLPGLGVTTRALAPWIDQRRASEAPTVSAESEDSGGLPTPIVYKPRRRAILQSGDLFLRAYASTAAFEAARNALTIAPGLLDTPTVETVGDLPSRLLLVQRRVTGRPLIGSRDEQAQLGSVLASLHSQTDTRLAYYGPADHLAAARTSAALVTSLLPGLAHEVERAMRELALLVPDHHAGVVCHGDFHLDQALIDDGTLTLLDLENLCVADPALDLASYAAHQMVYGALERERVLEHLSALLAGYGPMPAAFDWYLAGALLRVAPLPCCFLEADWPTQVEQIVRQATASLHS